jgi:glycine/D-amino acid oxidase-like deaminating enzyme
MEQPSEYDVLIVGGGIVGCMNAFWLARGGQRVAIIERHSLASGTTNNSFAWVNATSKTADEAYHRLNALGQAIYRELAVEFGEDSLGLNPSGMLNWTSRSNESAYNELRNKAQRLSDLDYAVTWIGARELAVMEPHMRLPEDAEALYAPGDPCLDAPSFVRFIAARLTSMGAGIYEHCAAQSLELDDNGVVQGVVTAKGLLRSPKVLIAAGPSTPEVLAQLTGFDGFETRFPMNRVPGLLVSSPSSAPKRLIRHIHYVEHGKPFHMLPLPNGGIKIGADDTDGIVSDEPSEQQIRDASIELLERARSLLPGFAGSACIDDCRIGIGVRPYPQDGFTIAGAMPGSEGLYIVATHSGITLSPAIGRLMAEIIIENRVPSELRPFGLERFQAFA